MAPDGIELTDRLEAAWRAATVSSAWCRIGFTPVLSPGACERCVKPGASSPTSGVCGGKTNAGGHRPPAFVTVAAVRRALRPAAQAS